MKRTKNFNFPTPIVVDVICDSCGQSCLPKGTTAELLQIEDDPSYDASCMAEYITVRGEWGYFSKKDTERWEAHICEKCVDEKLSFIKFQKTDYTNGQQIK